MPCPLIDYGQYDAIFELLRAPHIVRIGIVENAEDELLRKGMELLWDHHGVRGRTLQREELNASDFDDYWIDVFLVYGASRPGGELRRLAPLVHRRAAGRPVVYLPGVYLPDVPEAAEGARCFTANPAWRALGEPAPELCLALDGFFPLSPPLQPFGIFLAGGSRHAPALSLGDPLSLSPDYWFYLHLATRFEHVVTDRPRFAIAALLADRRVTLLPDDDGLNRSLYEGYLARLGCQWRDEPAPPAGYDPRAVQRAMIRSFCANHPNHIGRLQVPVQRPGFDVSGAEDGKAVVHAPGGAVHPCTPSVQTLWELCDGEHTVEEIIGTVADHVPGAIPDLAADVDAGLGALAALEAIETAWPYRDARGVRRLVVDDHDAPAELEVRPPRELGGQVRYEAVLRTPRLGDTLLWFEVPAAWRASVTNRADPFLLAALYIGMWEHRPLVVRGAPVNQSLLENLDAFQRAWDERFSQYNRVAIHAEPCADTPPASSGALCCYSGGIDSSFSLYHACRGGDDEHRVGAALMAQGLDIPAQDTEGFAALAAAGKRRLEDLGLPLITVRTNIRTLCPAWQLFHAPYIASCLTLFSGGYAAGLIPSTFSRDWTVIEGSNPVTDPLLGSRSFPIVHHGAAFTRFRKMEALAAGWPEALDAIRVCWRHPVRSANCGHCWKCLQTAMGLRALGVNPASLEHIRDADINEYIARAWTPDREEGMFRSALTRARERELDFCWLETLEHKLAAG